MIGYQVYAKFCKEKTKIDGLENKAFDDGNDFPETNVPSQLK